MTCSDRPIAPTSLRSRPLVRHGLLVIAFASAVVLVGLVPVSSSAAAQPSNACRRTPAPLRQLAARSGRLIGTAYRTEYAEIDPCYASVAAHEFNSLTPETATFPNALAPSPGPLQFERADAVCREATRHDLACGVHDVVWDPVDHPEWGIVPDWIKALPPKARHDEMLRLVTGVAHHFAGRHAVYSLANEVFAADGTLTPNAWNTTGDDRYLFDAYRAARLADPTAVLLYNDYGAEELNPKSDAVFDLARRLHAETVAVTIGGSIVTKPLLDGVGLQSHFGTGPGQMPSMSGMAHNIDRLGQAGLSVYLTELDVRVPVSDGQTGAASLTTQADLFRQVADTCLASPTCKGITLWGFTDARSWITDNPSTFSGQGAAHPFDAAYAPKAAYRGLHRAFVGARRAAPARHQPDAPASQTDGPYLDDGSAILYVAGFVGLLLGSVGLVTRRLRHRSGASPTGTP